MSLIVPAILGGLAITVMALVSLAAARKGRYPSASHQQGGQNQPRILVHSINDDRCTGCDACVAVCPTNVLDLVSNKSRVLRFQDCIQCEACMWACPTTALVMHLEGTEPPPIKMPQLDESFQTAVPGQYLIGEVAGKPLVKNAANLGRIVVEHMLRTGLQPWPKNDPTRVDVAIVGSGPGGLSAALSCIQRGLSYALLEKEQLVASTISRYPKGKWVMAEPYDVRNLSLLPVHDASKEQLVASWQELIRRVNLQVRMGEAVEDISRQPDGTFAVRTTTASYVAQRVILGTGTRGKPRTLAVPGENLPKVHYLLEDPDEFRGKPVIVTGGGDSAVEAAMALADAGAKVVLSYRGRSFNRCAPKNRQAIESYDAQKRVKIRYQSNIVQLTDSQVTLQMQDGSTKVYPNEAAFVLIGADPPIKWLQKVGVNFVERPHGYALGKTDELLMRLLGTDVQPCPEDPVAASELVLHGRTSQPAQAQAQAQQDQMHMYLQLPPHIDMAAPPPETSGARKWLRNATQMFTLSSANKKVERPVSLSEFAKRQDSRVRRDALPAAERTRILRMLRDDGARLADEDSRVDIAALPAYDGEAYSNLADDPALDMPPSVPVSAALAPAPAPPPPAPPPSYAQASGFGLPTGRPPAPPSAPPPPMPFYGGGVQSSLRSGAMRAQQPVADSGFSDEPTRRVDPKLARQAQGRPAAKPAFPDADEATRAVDLSALARKGMGGPRGHADIDEATRVASPLRGGRPVSFDEPTRAVDVSAARRGRQPAPAYPGNDDEATRAVNVKELERLRSRASFDDEATRAVDLGPDARNRTLSDVDWDLD